MLEFPPDITAIYQILLFVALWFALKSLIFDRALEILAARRQRTRGALDEAKRFREQAETLRAGHDAFMAEVRREGARLKDEIRRQGESEERVLLDQARQDATKILGELREQVAREVREAQGQLERETGNLSEQIVRTLLGGRSS